MKISGVATTRNVLGPVVRAAFRIHVTGAHHVPRRGGLILIANHPGIADAVVLAAAAPRPVRVVSEAGALAGAWAALSAATGRFVVGEGDDGSDALRAAVVAVGAGDAVGMFPEGRLPSVGGSHRVAAMGAAYVQVRSGAPVVPVALLGTHGRRPTDPPPPRSLINVVFGQAFRPPPPADPLARGNILDIAELLRQQLADHVVTAIARSGRVGLEGLPTTRKDGES